MTTVADQPMQLPAKRTRTNSPEIQVVSVHAADLWFDDGSIVISANSPAHDSKRFLFKVHRSALRSHSHVFADMLAASCADGAEIVEGCPVVELPDDADEVYCLLKALYDPAYYDSMTPIHIRTVESVLRLSTKYDVPSLRRRSIWMIAQHYPSHWQLASSHISIYAQDMPALLATTIRTINVARETNALQVLPYAMYCLLAHGLPSIFHTVSARPFKATGAEAPRCALGYHISTECTELAPAEIPVCITAYDAMMKLQRTTTHAFIVDPHCSEDCEKREDGDDDEDPCRAGLLAKHWEWHTASLSTLVLFRRFSAADWALLEDDDCCRTCVNQWRKEHEANLAKAWEMLPECVGLKSWEHIMCLQTA